MQKMISKKVERFEKKKKKLAALATLVKMNDKDREQTSSDAARASLSDSDSSDEKKIKKTKLPMANDEEEPHVKKVKLMENESSTEESDALDDIEAKKLNITKEQYVQLKKELKQRKRELENVPKLRLRPAGYNACLEVDQEKRTPIFLTDIQHLLMSALIGKKSPCTPDRWCFIEKLARISHTLVLVLDGVSLYHYLSNEEKFTESKKIFETKLEVVLPVRGDKSIIQDLATAPLTNAQAEELINKYGSLENAIEMNKDPTLLVKSIFPINSVNTDSVNTEEIPKGDKFPRTKLLLSALQMVDEGYPMPLRGELAGRFSDYVFTKEKYDPVTPSSPMFGVDCEMCHTTAGRNELTRISIVNEKFETVYETLVMPTNKIVDYLTKFSGITPELMATVTKKLHEVQEDVKNLLPADAILVGQSLNSDFHAMKMFHPYVIDTSVIFNITGQRRRKSKLQTLAITFLDQMIQKDTGGHDSVEDSLASIRLVQLKLKNSIDFGDEILIQRKRVNEIIRMAMGDSIKNNLFGQATHRDKRTAIITTGSLNPEVKDICEKSTGGEKLKTISCLETESNKESVKKAREVALENALTIANLSVDPQKFQLDSIDKTVEKVDKWITKLWKSVAHNGLFLVLFGGSDDCPSGLLQMAIKRNEADVANAVPVSV